MNTVRFQNALACTEVEFTTALGEEDLSWLEWVGMLMAQVRHSMSLPHSGPPPWTDPHLYERRFLPWRLGAPKRH